MASSPVKKDDPEPKISEVKVFKDPSGDPSSAYYLHPGENPGAVLVHPQLSEKNYHSWSRNMKRALLSKNKLKFVDGSIDMPEHHDPLFEAWERCNVMVLSWINRTLSTQIFESVVYIDIEKNLWDDLKERFSRGSHFRISDLLQEIHSIKQGERNVTQFYTDLKILWEELEYLRPIPRCTCGGTCQCDLSRISHNYRDLEYVICFLKGLNEVYSTVKTQVS